MTVEEMKNQIIEDFGFEDWRTISFFEICRDWADNYSMIECGFNMAYTLT